MNKADIKKQIKENWFKYHIPSMSNIHRIKRNAVFLNRHNDLKHELKKAEVCYGLSYFLTEAEENGSKRRYDVVDLISGTIYEIIYKHESDEDIKGYREIGIIPVFADETIVCSVCKQKYPKRNKGEICQICKKDIKK